MKKKKQLYLRRKETKYRVEDTVLAETIIQKCSNSIVDNRSEKPGGSPKNTLLSQLMKAIISLDVANEKE